MSKIPKLDRRSFFARYWMISVVLLLAIWLKSCVFLGMNEGSPLPTIDRVNERDLDKQLFVDDYVKAGRPLIIIREKNDQGLPDENIVPLFLSRCKNVLVPGIPGTVQNVLDSITPEQLSYASFLMKILIGVDLKQWIDDRGQVSITDIHNEARSPVSLKSPMPKLTSLLMPSVLLRMLEQFSRPLYMGDVVLWSNEYLENNCGIKFPLTRQEKYARSLVNYDRSQEYNNLFWGGIGSSVYPLHRDNTDRDLFVDVVSGCKEFVLIHPDERGKLTKLPFPGANAWINDFFSSSNDVGLERAWKGVINAGETLYMPGDTLHEARNNCPTTVSASRRPWQGSLFREINFPAPSEVNYE